MAIAKYKVINQFETEGETFGLGEEFICRDSVGEKLVQEGKVQIVRYLNPDVPDENEEILNFRKDKKNTDRVEKVEKGIKRVDDDAVAPPLADPGESAQPNVSSEEFPKVDIDNPRNSDKEPAKKGS